MNPWWYFVITLLLEIPVVLYGYKKQWRTALVSCLLLNLFTWPLLAYLLLSTELDLLLLEAGVLLVEMTGYKFLLNSRWGKAFIVALTANGLSYGAGLLINTYLL
jgi:hypothetical protein